MPKKTKAVGPRRDSWRGPERTVRDILDQFVADQQGSSHGRAKWIRVKDGSYTVIALDGVTGLAVQF